MKWIQTAENRRLINMNKQWGLAGYDLQNFSEMPFRVDVSNNPSWNIRAEYTYIHSLYLFLQIEGIVPNKF